MGGLVLFFLGLSLVAGGYQFLFKGRIFPGISMAGVDLSNLTPVEASNALNRSLTYPVNGQIVFRDGDRVWKASPQQLGMVFDVGTSVKMAYDLGRRGGPFSSLASQLNAWQAGLNLPPVVIIDERVAHNYLQNIADQIDQPEVEADLQLSGTDVSYTPGQIGRLLNVDEALKSVMQLLESFKDGEIQLDIAEQSPTILDASSQAEALRKAVSGPLTLTIPDPQPGDPGPWTLDQAQLASMIAVGRVKTDAGWQFQVGIDDQALAQFLGQIEPLVNQDSKNARFYFENSSPSQLELIAPAVTGRTLDMAATRDEINEKLFQGEHSLPLVLTLAKPDVPSDATAASLGITGLVYSYTSYFRGSSAARMQNIQAAAAQFDGLLVPPNSVFSMGSAIGDISLENGYAEALIIYNGQTITGVGGGVCQVSTTLFRTAFLAGYPIVERHAHAYRVYYYEESDTPGAPDVSLAGLDATVYFPLVDFKFKNDRPYWLLMRTVFNPDNYSLTWYFYSGDDGRTVKWQNLGLRNVTPAPDPLFQEDSSLGANQMVQTDWPEDGADITITRQVTRGSEVLFSDTIRTVYEPWQAVCKYGSGTADPEGLAKELGLCQ